MKIDNDLAFRILNRYWNKNVFFKISCIFNKILEKIILKIKFIGILHIINLYGAYIYIREKNNIWK